VIFDVGANVGQSSREFRVAFPGCRIFAFEPIKETFEALARNFESDGRVTTSQLALGRSSGTARMVSHGTSTGNRILQGNAPARGPVETVQSMRGDEFCQEHGIDFIDFLKIDTEGHDTDVVAGFSGMMLDGKIDFIQTECSFSPDNHYHVPFAQISALLFSFGFRLWGLFGLSHRLPRVGICRGVTYGDAVFVRETGPISKN